WRLVAPPPPVERRPARFQSPSLPCDFNRRRRSHPTAVAVSAIQRPASGYPESEARARSPPPRRVWYYPLCRACFGAYGAAEREAGEAMLLGEAIIAEIRGGIVLAYTALKHIRGSEGVAVAALVAGFTLLVAIPVTAQFM